MARRYYVALKGKKKTEVLSFPTLKQARHWAAVFTSLGDTAYVGKPIPKKRATKKRPAKKRPAKKSSWW